MSLKDSNDSEPPAIIRICMFQMDSEDSLVILRIYVFQMDSNDSFVILKLESVCIRWILMTLS